jgi:hypothetical protein
MPRSGQGCSLEKKPFNMVKVSTLDEPDYNLIRDARISQDDVDDPAVKLNDWDGRPESPTFAKSCI